MTTTEIASPFLDAVLTRLAARLDCDEMQQQCRTLAGATERARWLLSRHPELGSEFAQVEPLAHLLRNRARAIR